MYNNPCTEDNLTTIIRHVVCSVSPAELHCAMSNVLGVVCVCVCVCVCRQSILFVTSLG
jgi:hypothetical protein